MHLNMVHIAIAINSGGVLVQQESVLATHYCTMQCREHMRAPLNYDHDKTSAA